MRVVVRVSERGVATAELSVRRSGAQLPSETIQGEGRQRNTSAASHSGPRGGAGRRTGPHLRGVLGSLSDERSGGTGSASAVKGAGLDSRGWGGRSSLSNAWGSP